MIASRTARSHCSALTDFVSKLRWRPMGIMTCHDFVPKACACLVALLSAIGCAALSSWLNLLSSLIAETTSVNQPGSAPYSDPKKWSKEVLLTVLLKMSKCEKWSPTHCCEVETVKSMNRDQIRQCDIFGRCLLSCCAVESTAQRQSGKVAVCR